LQCEFAWGEAERFVTLLASSGLVNDLKVSDDAAD